MTTLRASKAPQVLACPGSMKHTGDTGSGPEAAMGRLLRGWVAGYLKSGGLLPALAGYSDDSEERMLWNMWQQMNRELVEPILETLVGEYQVEVDQRAALPELVIRVEAGDEAAKELEKALRGLSPGTLFNLVFFDSGVDPWRDELIEHEERSLAAAVEFANAQRAAGGTNIYDALILAFEDERVDTLYLMSDGDPTSGQITDPERILERIRQLNRTRKLEINAISIGKASAFLRRLAEQNGGVYVERL